VTPTSDNLPEDGVAIDVRRGAPTEEELAALIAVVSEAYTTEAEHAVVDDAPSRSAWDVSARNLRGPLDRALGWRHGGC
jgi:hypothetical protein